jgi:hypothetical protein
MGIVYLVVLVVLTAILHGVIRQLGNVSKRVGSVRAMLLVVVLMETGDSVIYRANTRNATENVIAVAIALSTNRIHVADLPLRPAR